MDEHKKLLEVRDLHVSFFTPVGEVQAVRGISYSLDHGEVMGIVGESGSGKSVEAYSIMGLLQPPGKVVGGSIEFEGENILELSRRQMRDFRGTKASMIFQNPMTCLNPVYTIGDQLGEALIVHQKLDKKEVMARVKDILTLVGINNVDQRVKQYPHELSGGMRQRVMIAMGLICHPKLLIADEPTTALDVTIQAQILELMKDIQAKTGMAIIFITHNLGVVAEIFYHPAHPYTRGLLRSMPRVDAQDYERLIPISGSPVDMLNPPAGCAFSPRCEECRRICCHKAPPESVVGKDHYAACWLLSREGLSAQDLERVNYDEEVECDG